MFNIRKLKWSEIKIHYTKDTTHKIEGRYGCKMVTVGEDSVLVIGGCDNKKEMHHDFVLTIDFGTVSGIKILIV